jgi:hypothetical protein
MPGTKANVHGLSSRITLRRAGQDGLDTARNSISTISKVFDLVSFLGKFFST